MNGHQAGITTAWALVGATALVAFDWWGTLTSDLQSAPQTRQGASTPKAASTGTLGSLEAYGLSYAILLLIAEDDSAGQVAEALAWAFAGGFLLFNFKTLQKRFPSMFASGNVGSVFTGNPNSSQPNGTSANHFTPQTGAN